ncbi:hypothetical protein ABZX51_006102 [Aspergillus tubingensis]
MALLLAVLFRQAITFPLEPFLEDTDVVPSANTSNIVPRDLVKRASRYPGVKYGATCSAAQQAYLDTELDEVKGMLRDASGQLRRIRAVIREKEQPATWGTQFADYTRILNSWITMIGTVKLTTRTSYRHVAGAGTPVSWTTTSRNMQSVLSVYSRILSALDGENLSLTIHCNDDFYVLDEAASSKTQRQWFPFTMGSP